MNYSSLVSYIQSYLENTETDFVAHIPQFVRSAEEIISRRVQLPRFRKHSTGSLTASNRFLSTPSDFLDNYSLSVNNGSGDYSYLKFVDLSYLREAYPDDTDTGLPKYYALADENTFAVAPVPDANYTVELSYFYRPESIVTASTSWIGDNAENALMWGSVVQAYIYLKGEADILAEYKNQFDQAIGELQLLAEGRNVKDTYKSSNQTLPT